MDNLDLPLLSNLKDIHIFHYVLDLKCDLTSKTFNCSVLVLCKSMQCIKNCAIRNQPVIADHIYSKYLTSCTHDIEINENGTKKSSEEKVKYCDKIWQKSVCDTDDFVMILDSHAIDVVSVNEVQFAYVNKMQVNQIENAELFTGYNCNNVSNIPSIDSICLQKRWKDAEKMPMEYFLDDWCLKIWKSGVTCGCCFPNCFEINFKTKPEGESLKWTMDQDGKTQPESKGNTMKCRLFTPRRHKEAVLTLISPYFPRCLTAAERLLGPYPFKRLDILIVPENFQSLGMASPSLMFLSQSVLAPDGEMLLRVAHELSHSWFGLLIGPRDWHEEWLSEGFCTYTEAVIHNGALGKSEKQFQHERQIIDYLKFRTLLAEINNTSDDLQHLRVKPSEENVIKNGMNPDKGFLQLHYIKGYFLLKFLEEKSSSTRFCEFLSTIVSRFHHNLITSKDILVLYFELFPELRDHAFNEDTVSAEWLDTRELPTHLFKTATDINENPFVIPVFKLMERITNYNSQYARLHWQKRRKLTIDLHEITMFQNVQTLVMLEHMLTHGKLHADVIELVFSQINYERANPEVTHRMCELIIKYKESCLYGMIHEFLIDHQAMGVYLFGELIISLDKQQRKIAENAFAAIRDGMDKGVKRVVDAMIYGVV
ncbi:aminopeptidase O-like isoform X3 [Dreissena polymorpha]|uniref:aminopeptidase O-like isoform X3 n=1 Tax=Dreissena polymorpha TaxID=45954 RepID=UPI0022656EAD|nr:aminopeptidase O-like isoform X3 [Dreissena polymorpha]